ncbi:MAG: hypothetical protein WC796_04400 [Candidatus Pacearchaeota archaeon]|jgi:hypothetical protein
MKLNVVQIPLVLIDSDKRGPNFWRFYDLCPDLRSTAMKRGYTVEDLVKKVGSSRPALVLLDEFLECKTRREEQPRKTAAEMIREAGYKPRIAFFRFPHSGSSPASLDRFFKETLDLNDDTLRCYLKEYGVTCSIQGDPNPLTLKRIVLAIAQETQLEPEYERVRIIFPY